MRLGLRYTEVGSHFNPEVGFYQRRGYRRLGATVFTFFRPDNFIGIHELRPHVAHHTIWNYQTGLHETQYTHMDNHWEWEGGHEAHTGINLTREGLFAPFEIFPDVFVPTGVYDSHRVPAHVQHQQRHTGAGHPRPASRHRPFRVRPQLTIKYSQLFDLELTASARRLRLGAVAWHSLTNMPMDSWQLVSGSLDNAIAAAAEKEFPAPE